MHDLSFWLGAGHIILLVLLGLVARDWVELEPAQRPRLLWFLLYTLVVTLLFAGLGSGSIPSSLVTVLHEGTSETNIRQLHGSGVHAGLNFGFLSGLWGEAPGLGLKDVVRMNLWLAALNGGAFFLIAWRVLGAWWSALALTVFFLFNRNMVHSALSEVPGQLLTSYFFMGVLAAAVAQRRLWTPGLRSFPAFALVVLLTLLAAATRLEFAVFGICFITRYVFDRVTPSGDILGERLRAALRWHGWRETLLLLGLILLSLRWWDGGDHLSWLRDGLRPLNPSILLLPVVLSDFLPLGLVVLALGGVVHSVRRIGGFFWLPVALVVLFRAYHSAGGGAYCDMFRYMTHLTPVIFFLALFGWKEFRELLSRKTLNDSFKKKAFLLLLILFLVPPFGLVHLFYAGGKAARSAWLWSGHNQKETRYLLELTEREPDAVFVTKLSEDRSFTGSWERFRLAFFGKPLSSVRFAPRSAGNLADDLVGQHWLDSRALFYHGLDCNLKGGGGCARETRGLELIEERVFPNPRLCDPSEYGEHLSELRLAVYALKERGRPIATLRAMVKSGPEAASVGRWLETARAALRAGGRDIALSALGHAEAMAPDVAAIIAIASLYAELGENASVRRVFGSILSRDATSVATKYWLDLANVAVSSQVPDLSLKALAKVEPSARSTPELAEMARLYVEVGERVRGSELLKDLIRRKAVELPAEGWADLAELARRLEEKDSELSLLRLAVSAGPDTAAAVAIARAYVEAGGTGLAAVLASGLLARLEGELSAAQYLDLAFVMRKAGERDRALSALRAALKSRPEGETKRRLAIQFQELQQYVEALRLMDELIAGRPSRASYWNDRGVLKSLMGRRAAAERDIRAALRLDPTDPRFSQSLEVVLHDRD